MVSMNDTIENAKSQGSAATSAKSTQSPPDFSGRRLNALAGRVNIQLKTSEVSGSVSAGKVTFPSTGSGQGLSGWFADEIVSENLRSLDRSRKLTLGHLKARRRIVENEN